MTFCSLLNEKLEKLHLLKHGFYQAWNMGVLSKETLQNYASEYYHHVAAFPRYISQIHALCSDLPSRQTLLGNLIEEEQGENNHPELWLRFAEGLGVTRETTQAPSKLPETQKLVDGYFDLVRTDYATGLGALYAYERQSPEISHSKIEGLQKHYAINDIRTLEFFNVHAQADEWHTEEIAGLLNGLSPSQQTRATRGAEEGAKLLWGFLDGISSISPELLMQGGQNANYYNRVSEVVT